MHSSQTNNVQHLAVKALALGWIDGHALWNTAYRLGKSEDEVSPHEALSDSLTPSQIERLQNDPQESWPESTLIVPKSEDLETHIPEKLSGATVSLSSIAPSNTGKQEITVEEEDLEISVVPSFEKTTLFQKGRYHLLESLGTGAEGVVYSASDKEIGRTVALKTLKQEKNSEETKKRFLNEAQLTARLEHPSVIPVYDIGTLNDQQNFYTMRIVKQRTLKEILEIPLPRPSWPLVKLCSIFVQVCHAMDYAHSRGVLHRDLKPANILLGDYGEVYVADWGIAKVLKGSGVDEGAPPVVKEESVTRVENEEGLVIGTPGYMAPEQIRAEWETIDHRADLFSLGAILYEILTGKKPFQGKRARAVMLATLGTNPTPPREIVPSCPLVLEDLCQKLLSKTKKERPDSAETVANEVEEFLEGNKEKKRRRQEADKLIEQSRMPASMLSELAQEQERLLKEAQSIFRKLHRWDPIEKKQKAWFLEDRAKALEVERARVLADTIELYLQALGYNPESKEAKSGLADIYWSQAKEAEAERKEATRIYYEELVRDYDNGRYTKYLSANAYLSLYSTPPGAQVWSYQYQEQNRILVPSKESFLGETPLNEVHLEPGSYLLILRHPEYHDARYPFLAQRGEHHEAHVNLYTHRELGDEFIYIPAGPCLIGGDPKAQDSLPREEVRIEDFAIARFPVTFQEYLVFINDMYRENPRQIEKRLPRDESGDGTYAALDQNSCWQLKAELLVEGEGKRFCPPHQVGRVPLFSIDWFDAIAYCEWRSKRDGILYRLPSELEYEKAARGADGRFFPWGDSFDPSFCKMRESRPGYSQPEPVGAFGFDQSAYGVCDMAGGIRTWLADIYGTLDIHNARQEKEPAPGTPRDRVGMRGARGGAWKLPELHCHIASRYRFYGADRDTTTGIRLVRPLQPLGKTSVAVPIPKKR